MKMMSFDRIRKVLFVFFIVVFLLAAFLLLSRWETLQGRFEPQDLKQKIYEYNGSEYVLRDNIETFLVLGLDKFEGESKSDSYNNDMQSDFLMLFVLDNDAKTCSVVHINRDTMTNVNILGVSGNKVGSAVKQIALAHTYGNGRELSCRNAADAVSELLLGIRVNHFISMTMDAVPIFNDMIGGVQVEIMDDFTYHNESWTVGSKVILFGDDALTYIRARGSLEDSSNISRMKRQRQYLNAVYEKIQAQASYLDDFSEDTLELSNYIVSDRSVNQLQSIVEKFREYAFNGIYTIDGEAVVGDQYMEFYADEDSILETVVYLFCEPKN